MTTADRLAEILDRLDAVECTRSDGNFCRLHFDTDLCPVCVVGLEIDRLHRELTGGWICD